MKFIFLLTFHIFLLSCVTAKQSQKSAPNLTEFLKIGWPNRDALISNLGSPSTKEDFEANGLRLESLQYETQKDSFEFLIETKNQKVVEKRYIFNPNSTSANLEDLLKEQFQDIKFERIRVSCRHYDEIVLSNRKLGLLIVTKERPNATAAAISFSESRLFNYWIDQNAQKKCSY